MTLRVLAICKEDPNWILGGMGRHVGELYRHMGALDGVEVDLLTSGPGEGTIDCDGYTKHPSNKHVCFKPPSPGMSSYLIDDLQMVKTLTRLIAQGRRWDVVHNHEWGSVQVSRLARHALQVPQVSTMHLCISHLSTIGTCPTDQVDTPNEPTLYLWQQEGNLICDPNELILCSNAYVDLVRRTFMTQRPITMIPNGIDLDTWNPDAGDKYRAQTDHNLTTGRPVCLYVGRIADMKGIRPLLDAVEYGGTGGWQVVLCGEVNANTKAQVDAWDVTKRIRELTERLPDRLRWVGFQTGQALFDLYAAADVVIMPSVHEPFGIVALEAMASGAPLIATEVDGLGEIVNDAQGNEYALIIRPDSAADIQAALSMCEEARIRNELRDLGLKRARAFDWNEVAKQTVGVYERALQGGNHACTTGTAVRNDHDRPGEDRGLEDRRQLLPGDPLDGSVGGVGVLPRGR